MKKTSIILGMICLLSISSLSAQAQEGTCGTVGQLQEDFIPDLRNNIRAAEENPIRFRSTQYLPIKFHIISETDGTNGVRESRILDQLAALNEDFANIDVQFYLKDCAFNYIDNSTVFENHEVTIGTIMKANKDNSAINVFIPETADRSSSNLGRTLGYYLKIAITNTGVFDSDWIVMRKSEVSASSITLTHELGHFFTLAHPHRGWDREPYDAEMHGNPVQANSPNLNPTIPTELQDKSNCTTAGDLLCDTPPDYNFGISWNNCDYDTGTQDPNGTVVDPEEKLYMGYFNFCSSDDYFFSSMQQAAMIASLNGSDRDYIRSGWTPSDADITANTTLEFPADGEELGYFNDIPFKWSTVVGANKYLLEISRFTNYQDGSNTFSFVVNGNSKIVEELAVDRTYFWRVRPFNCYDTAMPFTESGTFRTGSVTKVDEPEFIEALKLSPNPVRSNASLQLELDSKETFEGQISWYSISGQRLRTEVGHRFLNGSNRLTLSTADLSAGVYFLALETAEGRITRRVAILP